MPVFFLLLSSKYLTALCVGETGRRFENRMAEQPRGKGDKTTNSSYTRQFLEIGHKFVNQLENVKLLKVGGYLCNENFLKNH